MFSLSAHQIKHLEPKVIFETAGNSSIRPTLPFCHMYYQQRIVNYDIEDSSIDSLYVGCAFTFGLGAI